MKVKTSAIFLIIGLALIAGCAANNYTVKVDLTPERKASLEAAVKQWDSYIANPKLDPANSQTQEVRGTQQTQETQQNAPLKPKMEYFTSKAVALEYLGRYGDAIDAYSAGLALWPQSIVAWNNMAKLYEKMNDFEKAAEYYDKIIQGYDDPSYYYDLVKVYLKLGKKTEAKNAYMMYKRGTGSSDSEYESIFSTK